MNRPNIAVLDAATFGDDLDLSPLASIGDLTVHRLSPPDTLPERRAGADIAVLNKVKLGPRELAGASRLRLICVFATGFDNIDVGYCRSRGIAVCNVVGSSTSGVAQLTAAEEKASSITDSHARAAHYSDVVIPLMRELRSSVDRMEVITAASRWPFPSYGDMMFRI